MRKVWVQRPNASATLVQIREDDLVDDVREMILKKYANSLGKSIDAPDMTLRIVGRKDHTDPRHERVLGPEEEMCRTIDMYYPGGQTVEEALIIDVPHKRTPRPSPRNMTYSSYHAMDEFRPHENGTDYFPPMPAIIHPTMPQTASYHGGRDHHHSIVPTDPPKSISILNTGQVPPLPSPGGGRRHRDREHRPKYGRQHTSSPTILNHGSNPASVGVNGTTLPGHSVSHRQAARPRVDSSASEVHHSTAGPPPPPLPSPPAPEAAPTNRNNSNPPTPPGGVGVAPHSHRTQLRRKVRKSGLEKSSKNRSPGPSGDPYGSLTPLPSISSMLDDSVPPINVLLVEDNIINLRILGTLMKRLKVRWQTAMNGQIAVDKWKAGGFHLVLMDIQMPVMNGLQATKEIRRLERVNGIGVFSSSTPGTPLENGYVSEINGDKEKERATHNPEDDKLVMSEGHFKSPVIIVALTASSLQSDRHEALAAGCNDFLTKPVSFLWLERKVKEWGCMQALIDFDGWRRWKDDAAKEQGETTEEQRKKAGEQEEKPRNKTDKLTVLQEKQRKRKEEELREKDRNPPASASAASSAVQKSGFDPTVWEVKEDVNTDLDLSEASTATAA